MTWILHIDMDAFFASVEQLDNPALRGKPVIVGGGKRGVVSAASYEARAFGVRSAMPTNTAQKLCPHAIFVTGRRQRYVECSRIVMETLGRFSPLVEPASIDEAYVDADGLERLFGPIPVLMENIQEAVRIATHGLSCSIGAAPVKFLAKIASDMRKPQGLYVIYPHEVSAFLQSLPIQKIPGVGKKFYAVLQSMGIAYAGDVARFPLDFWERRFGKGGVQLWQRACGKDSRKVELLKDPKSESAENTFEQDTLDTIFLQKALLVHAEKIGTSLRKKNLGGRTISLKIKYADFTQVSRSHTLPQRTHSTQCIFKTACDLLAHMTLSQKVRLIGISVSHFQASQEQGFLPLIPQHEQEEQHCRLDKALDTVRERFGTKAIVRGRLFDVKNT